jgi:hypothetical protein
MSSVERPIYGYCILGHKQLPKNVYVVPKTGAKSCKICKNHNDRIRKAKARTNSPHLATKLQEHLDKVSAFKRAQKVKLEPVEKVFKRVRKNENG